VQYWIIILTSVDQELLFSHGGETEPTWYCGRCFGLFYQPQMTDDDDDDDYDCEAIGRMRIGRGKPKYSEKPAAVPLCPPQIPHDLSRVRTRAARMGIRRLTASAWHGP
jgi:hypothetical protein